MNIDHTRNNELSSTIIAKYRKKKTIKSVLKVVVLAMINKKTNKELVTSSWKNRD